MRVKQLIGMVALFAVGLVGCGPVEDDGRGLFAVRVSIASPTPVTAFVSVDYEVHDEFEVTLSEGNVMTEATVRNDAPVVVDHAIYVLPGNQLRLTVNSTIEGQPFIPHTLTAKVEEDATGVALHIYRMETRDEWILSSDWIRSTPE